MKSRKIIKVAIDSPSAAGAGSISKKIAKHYNLIYCDTGKIYRLLAFALMGKKVKNKIKYLRKVGKKINLKKLQNKNLLNNEVAYVASQIAKDIKVRKIVFKFQKKIAYKYPKKYNGSCLDGRDITHIIVPDADFKFYITANLHERSKRRFKELKKLGKKVSFKEVLKSMNNRDRSDKTRTHSMLKKTKDSYLINTTGLTIRDGFLKIKKIMDKKLKEKYGRNL